MAERRRSRRQRLPAPLERATRPLRDRQEEIQRWVQRIQRARKVREEWAAKFQVDLLAQTFTGELQGDTDEDAFAVMINRFLPTVKAQMAGLLAQNPKFFVRAEGRHATQVSYEQAASCEATLYKIAQQDNHLVQEAELALQQSFWAIGVLKAIYDPQLERNPQRGRPMYVTNDDGEPLLDEMTGQPVPLVDPRTGEPMTQPAKILKDEVYRWQWVNWHNMLLPDEGPAMLRWTWIGEEVEVPVEDAKEDERFPAALRSQLVPTTKPRSDEAQQALTLAGGEHELDRTLWYTECWDMKGKRHRIYAPGQPFSQTAFLLDDDLPDGVEDHPYAILPGYTAITDPEPSPWPVPQIWNWLGLHKEYNLRRLQMMNAAKRSARKYFYSQDTFPNADDALSAMDSNRDMEGVMVTDLNHPPVVLTDPGSTPDIARDLVALEKDWLNATGLPGERTGNATASDTATQAIIADRAASLREGRMKNAVNLLLTTCGKKMLQLVKGTMTLSMWVKIRDWTDAEVQEYLRTRFGPRMSMAAQQTPGLKQLLIERYGREKWTEVTREQLTFEADVGVTPGSARGQTPEQRRQQMTLFVQALAQIAVALPTVLTAPAFTQALADLFEVGDELMVDQLIAAVERGMQQGMIGRQAGQQGNGASAQPTPGQVLQQPTMGTRLESLLVRGGV